MLHQQTRFFSSRGPLILIGLALFLVGFAQIYWAKFTGRAAVELGLYRYVRHPQYVALALVGLGTTFYWSRFIVLVAYVTMLFLYYFLANHEERVCVEKFGDALSCLSGEDRHVHSQDFCVDWRLRSTSCLRMGSGAPLLSPSSMLL